MTPTGDMSVKATYNGEAYDPRTGDIYLRARYYNTHTGTFTTEDTYLGELMDPRSLNRYAYAHGNAVNYQDPSGHDAARQQMVNENRENHGLPVYSNNRTGNRRKQELEDGINSARGLMTELCYPDVQESISLELSKP